MPPRSTAFWVPGDYDGPLDLFADHARDQQLMSQLGAEGIEAHAGRLAEPLVEPVRIGEPAAVLHLGYAPMCQFDSGAPPRRQA